MRNAVHVVGLGLSVLGLSLASYDLGAQGYPARPLRMICPCGAGGAADVPGRIVAQRLGELLGQQVVMENRAGAGATIGAEIAAKAPPDGYTLFLVTNTHFVSGALYKKLAYDPLNDYTPITQITSAPNVLVVHPSLPVNSVKELVALARAKPRQINYGSSGNGSTQHMTAALFSKMAGIELTHIPYRGVTPVTAAQLGGEVMVVFPGIAGMIPHIKSGKLRALGVSSAKRSSQLPDVPTIHEAGIKGYELVAWNGVLTPKGLPRDIQMKLHADVTNALRTPEVRKSLVAAGQEPTWQETPALFFEFLKSESAKWAKLVKDTGLEIQ